MLALKKVLQIDGWQGIGEHMNDDINGKRQKETQNEMIQWSINVYNK